MSRFEVGDVVRIPRHRNDPVDGDGFLGIVTSVRHDVLGGSGTMSWREPGVGWVWHTTVAPRRDEVLVWSPLGDVWSWFDSERLQPVSSAAVTRMMVS